jgi:outer membrane protein TolC
MALSASASATIDPAENYSGPDRSAEPRAVLSLVDVTRAALEAQPLLDAQAAQIEAYQELAVSAGSLPDPQLMTGINELPVNTADAWSLSRDGDTDLMVGLSQEFPRAVKRRLRRSSMKQRAMSAEDELDELKRLIRRDAGLQFLDLLLAEKSAVLARAQVDEADARFRASAVAVRAGELSQDQALAAAVTLENLRDSEFEFRQQAMSTRSRLQRWIGELAHRPLDLSLPVLPEPRVPADMMQHLSQHPALRTLEQQEAIARTELELAQAAYKPDWRVEVGYGYRPAFSEMVSVRVVVDLPFFTRNRQDRGVAAARHELRQATALRDDELRHHVAESAAFYQVWQSNKHRAAQYSAAALPAAQARVAAATAAFRAARQPLTAVFEAQAALLDAELHGLQLEIETLRNRLEIDYFIGEEMP